MFYPQKLCQEFLKIVFLIAMIICIQLIGVEKGSTISNEKPIVIVIPSYNNFNWFQWNLNSILMQKYNNYRVIYVNDCSSDGMGAAVEKFVRENVPDYRIVNFDDSISNDINTITLEFILEVNKTPNFFILVQNKNRSGALANLYRSIYSCDDEEIIATVDGDDWLYDHEVLKRLNEAYSSGEIWLTHGTLVHYPKGDVSWSEPVPRDIITRNAFRNYKCPSHLRTFYAWLFKKIRLQDLVYEGKFYPMTWDMAMMYPMIEMAGERHKFLSQVNYVYNTANQLNDNKVNAALQNKLDKHIRGLTPYQRIQ